MVRYASILILCLGRHAFAQPSPAEPPQPPPPPPPAGEPADPTTPTPVEPDPQPPAQPAPAIAVQTAPPPPDPEPSDEERQALANYEPSDMALEGFLQARLRKRQDSAVASDRDGFALARARLGAIAHTRAGNIDLSARIETDVAPEFRLLDAYAIASRYSKNAHSRFAVQVGQMRVPISRQQMLSESMLGFIDKAELASLVPERDVGIQLSASLAGFVGITGGAFNGEGPNQLENGNQRYLWAGRVELSPIGETALAESAFGKTFATLGVSFGRNRLSNDVLRDEVGYLGIDIAFAHKGVSGSFEYLRAKTETTTTDGSPAPENFTANGFTLQASYLLPQRLPPYKQSRFELGGRLQEIDRNDQMSILAPGDPNQSVRAYSAVASWYLRSHSLKAQLEYTRFEELEDRTAFAEDAVYDNDQLVLQVTYKLD